MKVMDQIVRSLPYQIMCPATRKTSVPWTDDSLPLSLVVLHYAQIIKNFQGFGCLLRGKDVARLFEK